MSKSYKAIIWLLIAILLIVAVSLFFAFRFAQNLKEQNEKILEKMEKQVDEGQLIGAAFFLYSPN